MNNTNSNWSMKVQGVDGVVELLTDRIIITRPGLFSMFSFGLNSKRELPYASVTEVLFNECKALAFGSIEFIHRGVFEPKHRRFYIVRFKKQSQPKFAKLKDKIYEILHYYGKQK